jgi:hypothetical protein
MTKLLSLGVVSLIVVMTALTLSGRGRGDNEGIRDRKARW